MLTHCNEHCGQGNVFIACLWSVTRYKIILSGYICARVRPWKHVSVTMEMSIHHHRLITEKPSVSHKLNTACWQMAFIMATHHQQPDTNSCPKSESYGARIGQQDVGQTFQHDTPTHCFFTLTFLCKNCHPGRLVSCFYERHWGQLWFLTLGY